MEEELRRALGESAEEVAEPEKRGDVGDEAAQARARKTGAAPRVKEVEECNLDHAALRSWQPSCVRERVESRELAKKVQDEGEAPIAGVDYTHTRGEQENEEEEEEKGVPISVAKDNKTRVTTARVAASRGVDIYTVEKWWSVEGAGTSSWRTTASRRSWR